jgi:hypothetical protein
MKAPLRLDYESPFARQRRVTLRVVAIALGIGCVGMAFVCVLAATEAAWRAFEAHSDIWRGRHLMDATRFAFGVLLLSFLAWVFLDRPWTCEDKELVG